MPSTQLGTRKTSVNDTDKESCLHGADCPGDARVTLYVQICEFTRMYTHTHTHTHLHPLLVHVHMHTSACAPGTHVDTPGPTQLCAHGFIGLADKNNLSDYTSWG